jgi:hypothetical protein
MGSGSPHQEGEFLCRWSGILEILRQPLALAMWRFSTARPEHAL